MRFGVSRWGRHLLMYGGMGNHMSCGSLPVARLNLETLRWDRLAFTNKPPAICANAFETGAPASGCVVGGAQMTSRGPRVLSRLVVFRFRDTANEHDGKSETTIGNGIGGEDSDEERQRATAVVRLQLADGREANLQIPFATYEALQRLPGRALERFVARVLAPEGMQLAPGGVRGPDASDDEQEEDSGTGDDEADDDDDDADDDDGDEAEEAGNAQEAEAGLSRLSSLD